MHSLPQRTLRQLLSYYGPSLLHEPERVDAILADLCGPYHRERFLLVHALRERIPTELLAQPQGGTADIGRLSQRLQRRYGFSAEAANWAVTSWALALNIAPLPSRLPRPLASLIWFLQRNIPHLQMLVQRFPSLTSKNSRNRVQYRGRAWWFLPKWALIGVLLCITILVTSIVLVDPLRELWASGLRFQQTDADEWQVPSLEQAHALLLAAFPPPQEARIETDLLNVRASPAVEAAVIGEIGPQGGLVTVDSFSTDGRWAHISAPVQGWISNDFASYAEQTNTGRLFIRPEVLWVQIPGSKVFAGPTGADREVAALVADQIVIVLGITTDGSRLRIAEPVAGWIDSTAVKR